MNGVLPSDIPDYPIDVVRDIRPTISCFAKRGGAAKGTYNLRGKCLRSHAVW